MSSPSMPHVASFLDDCIRVCQRLDDGKVEQLAEELRALRERRGRLFVLGIGGSAANASHAVCDFRHLCGIDAIAPTDNIASLTATANDYGFDTIFGDTFRVSHLNSNDALLILSVGGGAVGVSQALIHAIDRAKVAKAKVYGIVGKEHSYTHNCGDLVIVIPQVNPERITPLSEAFQAVIWHALVSHPKLQINPTKW